MNGKAFIWDLDGTLLDSYGVIVSSLRRTLEELGIPMEEDEIRRRATAGSVSDVVNYAAAATGRAGVTGWTGDSGWAAFRGPHWGAAR